MSADPQALEAENQRLRERLAHLSTHAQALQTQIQELEAIRRDLEHTVALYKRCLFGSRSEKVDPAQLEARIAQYAQEAREAMAKEKRPSDPPPEAEEEQAEPVLKKKRAQRKARPHGRGALPAHLPRRRIEHPLDPAQCVCSHCVDHPSLVRIGEDVREKLHKLPVQYEVLQHVYPKLACPRCDLGIRMPEGPDQSLKAEVSVVADVVVQKYAEHKPLYRQQQAFARLDIPLTRQTLCDWTGWCSQQVEPVVKAMAKYICAQQLIQSDETPVRMQLPDGQMQTARLWVYGLAWAEVVFDFRTDKSQTGPKEFLQGTQARYLQADGGSSYLPVLEELKLEHIPCMAHIRRKILEGRQDAPMAADLILASIQKLYRIENQAKAQHLSPEAVRELRQREAQPIFTDLGLLMSELAKNVLPKSPLGRGLSYAKNYWPAMARYLEIPAASIDNNSSEHALRDVVLGRKNWLHVGQESGGERAANLFSLMVTCKRLKVEPYAYLHDILQRLPKHLDKDIWQLTPRGWKETFGAKTPPTPPSG
jgi:transposase/exonuclease VII small subunit